MRLASQLNDATETFDHHYPHMNSTYWKLKQVCGMRGSSSNFSTTSLLATYSRSNPAANLTLTGVGCGLQIRRGREA